MDTKAIARVIRLRYRLHWARVRSSPGQIALFVAAVLVLASVTVFAALGAAGTVASAARAHLDVDATLAVLTAVYAAAIAISIFVGVGIDPAFSNAALRRYPLAARERFVARHVLGLLDPLWLLVCGLDAGVAAGCSITGRTAAWAAPPTVLLLLLTNILLARVLAASASWVISRPAGPALSLMAGVGAIVATSLQTPSAALAWVRAAAHVAPPGAAARIFAGTTPWQGVSGFAWLLGWTAALWWVLGLLEQRPAPARAVAGAAPAWNSAYDRFGSLFGHRLAPLVGKMLRYYARSPQLRWNYPFVLPVVVSMAFRLGGDSRDWNEVFVVCLGALPAIGLCSGSMSLNVFGFDAAGFTRYLLLPVKPGLVLRAAFIVSLLPGALLVVIAVVAWAAWSPSASLRADVMLLSSGVAGLVVFDTIALWISVVAPRRADYFLSWGNRLSGPANAVLVGGIGVLAGLPLAIHVIGVEMLDRLWFVWPGLLLASVVLHVVTHPLLVRRLMTHREETVTLLAGGERSAGRWLVG